MKAFVTGGTGFIGSHLVDTLLDDSSYSEVRCLIRSNWKWLKDKNIVPFRGDLDDLSTLGEAVQDVDVVFHIAGRVKAPTYRDLKHANVDATENILRIAQKKNVPKVVVLSSLAATGPSQGRPVTEEDPLKPVSMYGRSKKQMEQRIHEIAEQGTSVTILRPPAVYGPREEQIYSFFKMVDKRICPIIGDGEKPEISMIYVGDVIQGILKASRKNSPGVATYFLTDGKPHTWNEIRSATTTVLGKKSIPIYVKPGLVKKIAGTVEKAASFFGVYPVLNREKAREMILEWTCSTEKAREELGYAPQYTLEEGLARTIHWYQRHHWL
ncbi:NAD-dependent epimerase/dehydratase family protein [Fodinibius sediminis]|uniref:Nucleoside-diphosphate-sugar epimerase n=1 Tax=Fodinibius sediminis TaxID=1214077 RepID=A0A521C834_9BACT|nr:NAD(P)-dependent oxidoreductase [Fodinibius sediminis]SMO55554.1 Nucleoside-diphosphate-sugar epimerase [Fodinibius sediminis]